MVACCHSQTTAFKIYSDKKMELCGITFSIFLFLSLSAVDLLEIFTIFPQLPSPTAYNKAGGLIWTELEYKIHKDSSVRT